MIGTIAYVGWALGAKGLTPEAKLVLILSASAADMDGRVFNVEKVRDLANLTDDGFKGAMDELTEVGLAAFGLGVSPLDGGPKRRCIVLEADERAAS